MEDLAAGMKSNLHGQGMQIENTRKNLRGIREDAGLSKRALRAIETQRKKNKCLLYSIYALLIFLALFLLWWRFGDLFSDKNDEPEVKAEY